MATARRADPKAAGSRKRTATATANWPPSEAQQPRVLMVAEPTAIYSVKPPAVVDASLIASLVFAEPEMVDAGQHLKPFRPVAPTLLPLEIANVAMNKLRRGGSANALRESLADLDGLGLTLLAVEPLQAFDLAARWNLSAYDAAYLALASNLRCPLLTFDTRLAEVARAHLGTLS